jgi:hypothetical protein
MKRLRKVIFGLLCMLLLSALSHATDIDQHEVKQEGEVKFAWEGTTKLTEDQEKNGCVVKYHLYVTDEVKYNEFVTDKKCLSKEVLPYVLIDGNEAERKFPDLGEFYIGVATAIYCPSEEEEISDLKCDRQSKIAWSHNKSYTNGNPFLVKVVKEKNQKK